MTFRTDISINWALSPRVITIAAPSTELTIQDLHDTLRVLEERPSEGLPYPQIIDTAGKEPLGGGVTVGLTATLLNAKISFEARKASDAYGTITTADVLGRDLIDAYATFITDGINPGAWVTNLDDGSYCSVIEIISETQILTDVLGDGYDNQFDFGDTYEIKNVIQCEVFGGNLVAQDADGYELDSILPTAGTQVVRTGSSSATNLEQEAVQFSSFNNEVSVDAYSSNTGTSYPVGNQEFPVNNIPDAVEIANNRGFTALRISGNFSLKTGDDVSGLIVRGENEVLSTIDILPAAETLRTTFENATISGILDGNSRINECFINDLNYVEGVVVNCGLAGTITLAGTADTQIIDCHSAIPGNMTPTIDCGGAGRNLLVRNYSGGLTLTNLTGAQEVSLDFISGQLIVDSTVTASTIYARGVVRVTDNSTGTAVIDTSGVINRRFIQEDLLAGKPVFLDLIEGSPGTAYPLGSAGSPVDNLADAYVIAGIRGSKHLCFTSSSTTPLVIASPNSEGWTGWIFTGDSTVTEDVIILGGPSVDMSSSRFEKCTLQGIIGGSNYEFDDSILDGVAGISGTAVAKNCLVDDYLTLSASAIFLGQQVGANTDPAVLTFGAGAVAQMFGEGDWALENMTGSEICSISLTGGTVERRASCTNGSLTLQGVGKFTNLGTGGTITNDFLDAYGIADSVWDEDITEHTLTDSAGEAQDKIEKIRKLVQLIMSLTV